MIVRSIFSLLERKDDQHEVEEGLDHRDQRLHHRDPLGGADVPEEVAEPVDHDEPDDQDDHKGRDERNVCEDRCDQRRQEREVERVRRGHDRDQVNEPPDDEVEEGGDPLGSGPAVTAG